MNLCFSHDNPHSQVKLMRDNMLETLNMLAKLVSSNLVPHRRMAINALLTIDVHNRDILNSMVDNKINRRDDFEWTRLVNSWLVLAEQITYTCIYLQIVGPTLFYLSCLRPNLNEIWHEDGPLAPNNRKNTTVQLP